MSDNIGKYSERYTKIRRISSGSKTILAAAEKYLEIDSGTNSAEILSIAIKGVTSVNWGLEIYTPSDDAVASPAAADKRDEITWNNIAEAGLIPGIISMPYNMFLDFTNNAGVPDDIDDVVVVYRSKEALTLTWET